MHVSPEPVLASIQSLVSTGAENTLYLTFADSAWPASSADSKSRVPIDAITFSSTCLSAAFRDFPAVTASNPPAPAPGEEGVAGPPLLYPPVGCSGWAAAAAVRSSEAYLLRSILV